MRLFPVVSSVKLLPRQQEYMGLIFSRLPKWTKTTRIPSVPQELIDEVLDHLAGDMTTLRSCSLVSKSWIHSSRRHLFSSVFFTATDITKWNASFPNPEDSPARHVRDLSFCFVQLDVPIHFADQMPYFSGVWQLTLIGRTAADPGFISALGQLPSSIRSVDITFSKVLTTHIISVMRQLPNLDNLSLLCAEWGGRIPPGTEKLIQCRLRGKLRLRRRFAHHDFLNMLTDLPTGSQFAEVEIRDAGMDCFPATLKFIRTCQDNLTKLHFSIHVLEQRSADQSFDFSGCARIQEVDLGAVYTSGGLYWITQALSTLNPGNSPLLSAVTLRLSVTLSLHGPGVLLGEAIRSDLSWTGHEMARIQKAYAGKVNLVTRRDLVFKAVLDSQPIWRDIIGEDTSM